jgi:hypothetical protein
MYRVQLRCILVCFGGYSAICLFVSFIIKILDSKVKVKNEITKGRKKNCELLAFPVYLIYRYYFQERCRAYTGEECNLWAKYE